MGSSFIIVACAADVVDPLLEQLFDKGDLDSSWLSFSASRFAEHSVICAFLIRCFILVPLLHNTVLFGSIADVVSPSIGGIVRLRGRITRCVRFAFDGSNPSSASRHVDAVGVVMTKVRCSIKRAQAQQMATTSNRVSNVLRLRELVWVRPKLQSRECR